MNILKFLRWLKGYIVVELNGDNSSLFLNYLIKNGVNVWDISSNNRIITLKVKYKDYIRIFNLRHSFSENVSIRHTFTYGFPFKIKHLIKRKSLLVGVLVFSCVLFILSRFVWTIDIVGNVSIENNKIINAYTELGVKVGMPVSSVNSYSLRDKLPLLIRDISWCSFNLEGTKLTINITEIKETDKTEKQQYSNIIALTDGVINHIEIISGNKMIKVGDVVKKGEVLVSGAPELNSQKFTYSDAQILAQTEREFKITVYKNEISQEKTGRITRLSVINFFGFKIPLYLDGVHYEYSSLKNETYVMLFKKKLPISFINRDYFEVSKINHEIDMNDGKENATAILIQELKKYNINEVKFIDESCMEKPECYEFTFKCQCIENIAKKQKINVST